MKVSVTGHRPNKLYGYDLNNIHYQKMKDWMKYFLKSVDCHEAISGMALGVDQLFALAVLELKEDGYNIKLHCAIPCRNHSSKWPQESQRLYQSMIDRADEVRLVTDDAYRPEYMQLRNEYMVNLADEVIAIWDGSKGGTGNCVSYAIKKNKKITIKSPNEF